MRKKILIVEDAPEYLFVLDLILRERGIDTELAPTFGEGINLLEGSFDLVLVDYLLDTSNGLVFIEKMREMKKFQTTPVFLLTTQSFGPEEMLKINQLRINYVQKPISPHALLKKISEHLLGAHS